MKPFKIAIIGCGGISSMHLAGYAGHPERVVVAATCDILRERAVRAQAVCRAPHAFASVEDAIDGADWDVAVVCTPTPVREEVVRPLAAAGKHIFVEKPMADSIEEARRMVAICAEAGVKMAVNQTYRYHYGFDIARRLIDEGRLGRVVNVSHREFCSRQDKEWRIRRRRHVLAVMGVHWVDGFRWMLGAEGARVTALTGFSEAIDCIGETDACVQILFDNGTIVSYAESFSCPGGNTDTVIIGERGVLELTGHAVLRTRENGAASVERFENPFAGSAKPETAFKLLDELLTAIETGGVPPNGCEDNLKTVSLLEAAWRSADGGEAVVLHEGLVA